MQRRLCLKAGAQILWVPGFDALAQSRSEHTGEVAVLLVSSDTSSAGRRQFSELNANSVRNSMPRRAQASTVARTASTPLAWPATRGRCREVAQRPLPSMMIAT